MKTIDKIVVSSTPPNSTNVAWFDGKNIKLPSQGKWKSTGGESGGGESAPMMIEVTWEELVALRDAATLIAGQKYRIIDYETMTSKEGSQAAGHPFDIIVTALDSKSLDEKASAIWSARDTDGYFANSNLPAWDVRYCLDNDTTRFDWAVGGGSIITVSVQGLTISASYAGEIDVDGTTYYTWETQYQGQNVLIGSQSATPAVGDEVVVDAGMSLSGTVVSLESGGKQGKGVIYELTDENKNKAPYDFKNIMFYEKDYDNFFYTFCNFSYGTDDSLTAMLCENNKIAAGCWSVFMETPCEANKVEEGCQQIHIGKSCNYNKINEDCHNIIIGQDSSHNTIHTGCYDIRIGTHCYANIVENEVNNVELTNYSTANVIRSGSRNIALLASGNMGVDCYDVSVSNQYADVLTITSPSNPMSRAFITGDKDNGILISSLEDIISKLNSLTNS